MKAFTLPNNSKCGLCNKRIKNGDIFTIIYEDDDSGNIKHLLCDDCEVDDEIQYYRDKGIVGSHLSTQAALANYYIKEENSYGLDGLREESRHYFKKYKKDLLEIAEGGKKIDEAIKVFEAKHWQSYLKKYWNDATKRGHEAKVDDIEVLMWGTAGRVLITVQRNDQDVTMIFSDEKGNDLRGGQQGIHGTQAEALNLIQSITAEKKIKFSVKESVTMAGL